MSIKKEIDKEYLKEILFILDKIYKKGYRNNFTDNLVIIGCSFYYKLFPSYLLENEFIQDMNWIKENSENVISFQERETLEYRCYQSSRGFTTGRALPSKPKDEKEILIFINDWGKFNKFYSEIKEKTQENKTFSTKKVSIWLDEKGIHSDSEIVFPFKITKGVGTLPRTKMIIFLSKQDKNIPISKITEKSGYSGTKALKVSVKNINSIFKSRLEEKFINHNKENGTLGINREKFNFSCKL